MRNNFTPEQNAAHRWQAESGTPVAEVCRKMAITEQTFYKVEVAVGGHEDRGADD